MDPLPRRLWVLVLVLIFVLFRLCLLNLLICLFCLKMLSAPHGEEKFCPLFGSL